MKKSFGQPNLQKLPWAAVRDEVAAINPELAAIIDDLAPDDRYPLYRASYSYGNYIVKKGKFQVPHTKQTSIALTDHRVDKTTQQYLSYNLGSNPVSFLLNNSIEVFLAMQDRTIPLSHGLIPKGSLFSTWVVLSDFQSLQPPFLWNVTAGCRSLFLLPKATSKRGHKRLQKHFQFNLDTPNSLLDYWFIFKEIANSTQQSKAWSTDILFFTKPWFERFNDPAWKNLKHYMLNKSWQATDFFRTKFIWDLVISFIQESHHIKTSTHILNTVKHLLNMGIGKASGFEPATHNEAAPIDILQNAYRDIYKLDSYPPVIMQLGSFSAHKNFQPIYYTMRFPTAMEFAPKADRDSSYLNDMYQIQLILNHFLSYLETDGLNIDNTPFINLKSSVKYQFFHAFPSDLKTVSSSHTIPQIDTRFIIDGNSAFPLSSSFPQGVIQLSKKI